MQAQPSRSNTCRHLWLMLGILIFIRLLTMVSIPLTDATEARYGEIARKMLETGNWVTPQHDYGVPFWAKPPLSTWLSAASMGAFGVNEFAARLPELILSLGMLAMVWYLGKRRHNQKIGLFSALLLFSFPMIFISAGAVMTDASLAFSVAMSFTSFWLSQTETDKLRQTLWGYLFFVGLGLGLLAKGPISGVMTLPPIFLWLLFRGYQWRDVWHSLPWIKGSLLMLLIATPWYLLAEHRTPGFIQYFIVGEHFERFLQPNWSGDLYGQPHFKPYGTIWLFWLVSVLPWSLMAIFWLLKHFRSLKSRFQDQDGWRQYLLWWSVWPMLFFTPASNIILPYVITGLPAFALLIAEIWQGQCKSTATENNFCYRHWHWLPIMLPALLLASLAVFTTAPARSAEKSQMQRTNKYYELRPSADSQLLYLFDRYYSAEFYTGGKARHSDDPNVVVQLINNGTRDFIVIENADISKLSKGLADHFEPVAVFHDVVLYIEKANTMIPGQ